MRRSNRPKSLFALRLLTQFIALLAGLFNPFCATTCLAASPGRPIQQSSSAFRGTAALADTRRAVSFGERPAGSDGIQHLRDWIVSQLKPLGGQLSIDSFIAQTPVGPLAMANILLKFPGTSGKAVVITGHYDTKRIPMVHFVGANDAGSSTGFLIEFARVISKMKHADDIYIVFFDGEEAVRTDWTETDSRYGSRHLVAKWGADGTLSHIKALINVDMIGDKDLDIANDENSSQSLRATVGQIAANLGYGKFFRHDAGGIDDDHKPFVDAGVNAIDIIDLDYGQNGSYWHTANDTMDKLNAHSFQVVGDVVLELVKELDRSGGAVTTSWSKFTSPPRPFEAADIDPSCSSLAPVAQFFYRRGRASNTTARSCPIQRPLSDAESLFPHRPGERSTCPARRAQVPASDRALAQSLDRELPSRSAQFQANCPRQRS
jgi:glutaminyl-peptide cyclotransferase